MLLFTVIVVVFEGDLDKFGARSRTAGRRGVASGGGGVAGRENAVLGRIRRIVGFALPERDARIPFPVEEGALAGAAAVHAPLLVD